ncbi:MAG: NADH-quinone oxidoreductase subunit E [Bacteroidales bacterium]|nr:NADH-quinone oxidoreductase subunit E [Bacteroidales bacterium]
MHSEMVPFIFFIPVILSFFVLIVRSGIRFYFVLSLTVVTILITSIPAISLLLNSTGATLLFTAAGPPGNLTFTIDRLSSFFILVTNFTVLTAMIYSKGYLKPYQAVKTPARLSLHYFSFVWLHLSMLGVLMLREGLAFLIAWELMAVSSFMLILFDAENRQTLKIAVNYLIQMHIGLVLLIIAFLLVEEKTGVFGFDGLTPYFSAHSNILLFFLFFAGFGIKAGFVPLHTWLPEAHPAAPSHVSGVMSGVMIKMGIYGIIRVLASVQADWFLIGIILLAISVISGILGVILAIGQHDLKKLLAYHSIENIGIIGMGIGIGAIGIGLHNPWMIFAGFAGAMLHVLNHSLFKSLLFFSAGSVYQAFHTRDIEKLGGVIHPMPQTAGLFLTGALAITGLPPLNGFISEILIYTGLIKGLSAGTVYQTMAMMLAIIGLVLIGGLAIFCFTKAFGITFLGSPRSEIKHVVTEAGSSMLGPQYIIAGMILLIGLVPVIFVSPLIEVITSTFPASPELVSGTLLSTLTAISRLGFLFLLLVAGLFFLRYLLLKRRRVEQQPTWGCANTMGNARQQYTATSYAATLAELVHPVMPETQRYVPVGEEEIFPAIRSFSQHLSDVFQQIIQKITFGSMWVLKKLARLQTGNIQHYILYAFVFILIIFALVYLNLL